MKRCVKCRQDKEHTEFHRSRANKDGLQAYCKPCCSRAGRAGSKAARKTFVTPEARKHYKATYQAKWPGKATAHNITACAIYGGRLVKQPCERCGEKNVHAHHDDYSKPLQVRWLCVFHHNEWHKENRTPQGTSKSISRSQS